MGNEALGSLWMCGVGVGVVVGSWHGAGGSPSRTLMTPLRRSTGLPPAGNGH